MFNIFSQYPTFVVFLAVVLSIVITMALMPAFIRALRSYHIGQQVRADGPESHLVKQGTPTMGGLIMLIAVVVTVLLIGSPSPETFALVIATVLAGALGLADDGEKVVKERSLGLTPEGEAYRAVPHRDGLLPCRGELPRHRSHRRHPVYREPRLWHSDHADWRLLHPVALSYLREHPARGHVQCCELDRRP